MSDVTSPVPEAGSEAPAASPAPLRSLAERMYPSNASVPAAVEEPKPDEPEDLGPGEKPLQDAGGLLPEDGVGYSSDISDAFGAVDRSLRESGETGRSQEVAQAATAAAEALTELGAYRQEARELSGLLGSVWSADQVPDRDYDAHCERIHSMLKREWGRNYEANLAAANFAEDVASERLPWLNQLLNRRPSADVIRHLARIGKRLQAKSTKGDTK